MLGLQHISKSLHDEQRQTSSARVNAYLSFFAGFMFFGLLAVMFGFMKNSIGATACVSLALGAIGKSLSDIRSAQQRSAAVLSAQATASVQLGVNHAGPSVQIPPKKEPTDHNKRVLSIMRLAFLRGDLNTVETPKGDAPKDFPLRGRKQQDFLLQSQQLRKERATANGEDQSKEV